MAETQVAPSEGANLGLLDDWISRRMLAVELGVSGDTP